MSGAGGSPRNPDDDLNNPAGRASKKGVVDFGDDESPETGKKGNRKRRSSAQNSAGKGGFLNKKLSNASVESLTASEISWAFSKSSCSDEG